MAPGGTILIANNSGGPMVTSQLTISFDNADLFSSATITGTAGGATSTATVNPITGGNSPEQTNNTIFNLVPPLVIPTGATANYTLVTTISSNPNVSMRRSPMMYAAMIPGDGFGDSGGFLASMLLLSLGTAFISKSRPRRMFFALAIVLLAVTSQVGCDNGSVGSSPSSTLSSVQKSTQTAMHVKAASMKTGSKINVAGLPIVMSTISVPK
jgi:hypothetical protein